MFCLRNPVIVGQDLDLLGQDLPQSILSDSYALHLSVTCYLMFSIAPLHLYLYQLWVYRYAIAIGSTNPFR
jgi:hypothetical protein